MDIVSGCEKTKLQVLSAEIYKPLTLNLQYRNGTQDFKFCVLPGSDFDDNYWKNVVAKNQDGGDKKLKVNMEIRKKIYEEPLILG